MIDNSGYELVNLITKNVYLDEKPFSNRYRFDVVAKKIKVTYEEVEE